MKTNVTRRRLVQSLALTAGGASTVEAAEPATSMDALRHVSAAHGANLTDDRLRIVKPVLEGRRSQLQAFREFEIDDSVEPTHGCL
jgi:hypothetical protein